MRLETGLAQCDDDWPGVFIRGDAAAAYHLALSAAIEKIREEDPMQAVLLQGLNELLVSSRISSEAHDKDRIQHISLIANQSQAGTNGDGI